MKLFGLVAVALAQDDYDYAFSDYSDLQKFGSMVVNEAQGYIGSGPPNGAGTTQNLTKPQSHTPYGHGRNRRYCHTTGHNRLIYQWNSNQQGGYFYEGRNIMECLGDELYCFVEERAQFGQIIGITAGCEQMANHPMVNPRDQARLISESYSQLSQVKNFYNQEAARGGPEGNTFFRTYYGLGGCLSVAAQNGQKAFRTSNGEGYIGTDSEAFDESKRLNGFRYGNRWFTDPNHKVHKNNFALNQCLRFPTSTQADAAPGNLLPFGVSVCRACCVAELSEIDAAVDPDSFKENICNYPPDYDTPIADQTDDATGNHELIPRFDMAWSALNEYAHMGVSNPNNLFVHGGYTETCGPGKGRGCRICQATDTCAAGANYTCIQKNLAGATCTPYPSHIAGNNGK